MVICERDLQQGSWKDLLEHTQRVANPPFMIVASLHADDYLWAEALNLGAYDVLAKPFDRTETRPGYQFGLLAVDPGVNCRRGKRVLGQAAEAVYSPCHMVDTG